MTRRRLVLLLALAAIAAILASRYFSPEHAVRRRLKAAVQAFEQEKFLDLARLVSRRYSDPNGLDYESLLGAAHTAFETYADLKLDLDLGSISIAGDSATVPVSFRVSGKLEGRAGTIAGSRSDPARAVLKLAKEHGDWMLTSIESLDLPSLSPPGPG